MVPNCGYLRLFVFHHIIKIIYIMNSLIKTAQKYILLSLVCAFGLSILFSAQNSGAQADLTAWTVRAGVSSPEFIALKEQCDSLNDSLQKVNNKKTKAALKKTHKSLCSKPKDGADAKAKLNKVKQQVNNAKKELKKTYEKECDTAAKKKTPKCKNLAKAVASTTPAKKPDPAGTAINKCGSVDTAFSYGCDGADSGSGGNTNPIFQVLFFIVNILAIGVGMAAIGGVIYGAILYTSAGDNGEQTKKGINAVVNAVLGVILFAFMYAILNFLVPGGLFS